MVYKKTEFTPEIENLLAEGLANMLGLFVVRKGLLWSVTNAYCKNNEWMADCILTTFTGVWLKNAGKKKTFPLEGKELLVPFFCLEGCGSVLVAGKEYPSVSFHIVNGSCFLSMETNCDGIGPFKGKGLNMVIPAEFAMCGMITAYDNTLPDTMYILTDLNTHTIKNGKCAWARSTGTEALWSIVPVEIKGFRYYGIPANELHGFTKQITDRSYCII